MGYLITITPDPGQLPFTGTLADILNGLDAVALVLLAMGLVGSVAAVGIGHLSGNIHAADRGKTGAIWCAVALVVIGSINVLVAWTQSVHLH